MGRAGDPLAVVPQDITLRSGNGVNLLECPR